MSSWAGTGGAIREGESIARWVDIRFRRFREREDLRDQGYSANEKFGS
jgi:hypothetical protein